MIRYLLALPTILAIGFGIGGNLQYVAADDAKPAAKAAKEETFTGTMWCAKCGLKDKAFKKCTNALVVKDGDKSITYYLDDKGNDEDYHDGLCGGGSKEGAKVTGTVTEKDGKKWIKPSKVEEKKKQE